MVINQEIKQIIIVRTDLKMSTGKKIAQGCHAAVLSSERCKKSNRLLWHRWFKQGQKKVVLKMQGEKELLEIYQEVKDAKIPCELVRDAGLTQIPAGSLTALGIGPTTNTKIDRITGNLKLY